MPTAADLERIVDGPGTKADRARALFALGCDRTDVVELLEMTYSQAHSIYKKGLDNGFAAPAAKVSVSKRGTDARAGGGFARTLRLSPSQTRFIDQDGHTVIRVDKDSGPVCRSCDRPLTFALVYLGFVHTDSKSEPTNIEDRYE